MTLKGALLIALICVIECDLRLMCDTPQYVERGEKGILECDFPQVFYGVFWYNSSDHLQTDPVAYLKYTDNGRERYESNGYSILLDGSVVINNVSLQHDRNFTAVILYSTEDPYYPNNIHVIVTVKPNQPYPHIKDCNENERVCFMKLDQNYELSCSVKGARPAVHLNWYIKSVANDRVLHSEGIVTSANTLYSSWVTTLYNVSHSTGTVVYVCKSINPPFFLMHEYSVILIQNLWQRYDDIEPETIYAKYLTSAELHCTNQSVLYLIWKKQSPTNHIENLVDSLFLNNVSYTNPYSNNFYLTKQRSLRINEVDVSYEGVYICTFGDGNSETIKMLNLQVYVLPDSPHLIIEGCSHQQYCLLFVPTKGELTCLVKGIRPQVKLQWEVVRDDQKHFINFSKRDHKIIENDFKYDISLTSDFHIQGSLTERFAVRCKAWNLYKIPFTLSTEIYLEPLREKVKTTSVPSNKGPGSREIVIYSIISAIIVIALIIKGIWVLKRRIQHATSRVVESEQELGLMINPMPTKAPEDSLREKLRACYIDICTTIRRVPCDPIKSSIEKIFVETGIEHVSNEINGGKSKKRLKTHHDIIDGSCQTNSRIILEGEAGYGKTTLCKMLAYDWCTKPEESRMKDVAIFILLDMSYLKNEKSIPSAIKRFLLTDDSGLSEQDVTNVLYNCRTLVIVLDGFDKYPHRDNEDQMDLKAILMKRKFQSAQVIVTTRKGCLPEHSSEATVRLQLVGFSKNEQETYIERVVCPGDEESGALLKNIFVTNPFIGDFCQVPLFFVFFCYSYKNKNGKVHESTKSLTVTLTQFVSDIIECFNKTYSKVQKYDERWLSALCKEALKQLVQNKPQSYWDRKKMLITLSPEFYGKCIKNGILVEEEFRDEIKHRYTKTVRFYHTIFAEWYAAHYLTVKAERRSFLKFLRDVESLYTKNFHLAILFASGKSKEAARMITKHLEGRKNAENLATLCIFEQSQNFTEIKHTIEKLCSSPVIIDDDQSAALQRATIRVLQMASSAEISIECLWLKITNCNVDASKDCLTFSSGAILPTLDTLRQISISYKAKILTPEELSDFLEFASLCPSVKEIRFRSCMLPHCLELRHLPLAVTEGRISMEWKVPSHEGDWYRLDVSSGVWRANRRDLSKNDFDRMLQEFQERNRRSNVQRFNDGRNSLSPNTNSD